MLTCLVAGVRRVGGKGVQLYSCAHVGLELLVVTDGSTAAVHLKPEVFVTEVCVLPAVCHTVVSNVVLLQTATLALSVCQCQCTAVLLLMTRSNSCMRYSVL